MFARNFVLPLLTSGLTALVPPPAAAEPLAFETPEAAVDAVAAAVEAGDGPGLIAVFGEENADLVTTGEHAQDVDIWGGFLRDYRARSELLDDGSGRVELLVGRDLWPFPAPLTRSDAGTWSFDAASAREEILFRRIGRNELNVIDLLHGYVLAQREFRTIDHDGDGVPAFANAILSDDGARNGLYWPPEPGTPESPIGEFVARASAEGYRFDGEDQAPEPYLGYLYQILTAQGDHAPGGAYDYMVSGHMLAGHALLAWPAEYGETGIMTFMVGESGVIYEADLGEDTAGVVDGITAFDPGDGWSVVEE